MNADIMPVAELPHRKEIKAAPTAPLARRRAGLSLWRGPPRARQATPTAGRRDQDCSHGTRLGTRRAACVPQAATAQLTASASPVPLARSERPGQGRRLGGVTGGGNRALSHAAGPNSWRSHPRWAVGCHTPAHENQAPGPLVNGAEGKHVRFRSGGEPGDLAGAQKEVASWLARRKQETARRKETWHGLAQQPGTHLRWESPWGWRAELRTAEQQAIAAVRGRFGPGVESRRVTVISAGGRSFTGNKVEIPDPGN